SGCPTAASRTSGIVCSPVGDEVPVCTAWLLMATWRGRQRHRFAPIRRGEDRYVDVRERAPPLATFGLWACDWWAVCRERVSGKASPRGGSSRSGRLPATR